jgi:peptide/nickel transport system permease protein
LTAYFARRVLAAFGIIWLVLTMLFFFLRAIPGDIMLAAGGERPSDMTTEQRERIKHDLGLDRPVHIQYFDWLSKAVRGDFGVSLFSKRPVLRDVAVRIPRTIELALASALLGAVVGISVGIISALNSKSWLDTALNAVLVFLGSLPVYVSGIVLILVFGLHLGWVPTGGFVEAKENLGEHLRLLILPTVALAMWLGAVTARMTRSTMLEVLGQDYVRTAFSKGLGSRTVYLRHALKNALIPVVTSLGLQVGSLLGGAVFTEMVFTWPGLGLAYVRAVVNRDYPVIQGVVVITCSAFIVTNLVVDLLVGFLDPRISYE